MGAGRKAATSMYSEMLASPRVSCHRTLHHACSLQEGKNLVFDDVEDLRHLEDECAADDGVAEGLGDGGLDALHIEQVELHEEGVEALRHSPMSTASVRATVVNTQR